MNVHHYGHRQRREHLSIKRRKRTKSLTTDAEKKTRRYRQRREHLSSVSSVSQAIKERKRTKSFTSTGKLVGDFSIELKISLKGNLTSFSRGIGSGNMRIS